MHPSTEDIVSWLETGRPAELGEHIGTCDRCSDEADSLSQASVLVQRFRSYLAAPEDFEERISWRVEETMSRWQAIEIFFELFSVGPRTAGLMMGDGQHGH